MRVEDGGIGRARGEADTRSPRGEFGAIRGCDSTHVAGAGASTSADDLQEGKRIAGELVKSLAVEQAA
jgi:hypothetical protein